MKTKLDFEDSATKELLSRLDALFFFNKNAENEAYSNDQIDDLYQSYNLTLRELKSKYKTNKVQKKFFLEGCVRKQFTGGMLPSLFLLDESRSFTIIDFKEFGKDLAHFKLWQIYYHRKVISKKVWDIIIKTGSILAISLSLIKILELCFKNF